MAALRWTPKQRDLIGLALNAQDGVNPNQLSAEDARYVIEWLADARPELLEEATWNSATPEQEAFAKQQMARALDATVKKLGALICTRLDQLAREAFIHGEGSEAHHTYIAARRAAGPQRDAAGEEIARRQAKGEGIHG